MKNNKKNKRPPRKGKGSWFLDTLNSILKELKTTEYVRRYIRTDIWNHTEGIFGRAADYDRVRRQRKKPPIVGYLCVRTVRQINALEKAIMLLRTVKH